MEEVEPDFEKVYAANALMRMRRRFNPLIRRSAPMLEIEEVAQRRFWQQLHGRAAPWLATSVRYREVERPFDGCGREQRPLGEHRVETSSSKIDRGIGRRERASVACFVVLGTNPPATMIE